MGPGPVAAALDDRGDAGALLDGGGVGKALSVLAESSEESWSQRYYKGEWARGWRDQCLQSEVAPDGGQVCSQSTTSGGTYKYIFIPFVVQWNLWLSPRLSAFVEPGVQLYHLSDHGFGAVPAASIGGRVRLSNLITLTAHLGCPTSALGLALLL